MDSKATTAAPSTDALPPSSATAKHNDIDLTTPSHSSRDSIPEHDALTGPDDADLAAPDTKNADTKNADTATPSDAPPELWEPPQRSTLKIALIMLSLAVAVLLVALDITIVTTALPTIAEEFNSASGYTWVGSAYLIANSAATPIWGKVSDIFGRKPCLLITNAIFFVGSLIAGLAINMNMRTSSVSLSCYDDIKY
jgi:hypothetical protein